MITIDDVALFYGSQAVLQDISIRLQPGTCTALLGRSGVGKSTLLNVLAGFVSPSNGSIIPTPNPRKVSFLFQTPVCLPWQTASENIQTAAGTRNDVNVLDVLQQVGLSAHAGKYPWQLSGGMLKRLSFAAVLAMARPLILLDEPTSGLDDWTKELVLALIRAEMERNAQSTCVFTTHSLRDAVAIADRVLYLAGQPARVVLDYAAPKSARDNASEISEAADDLRRRINEIER